MKISEKINLFLNELDLQAQEIHSREAINIGIKNTNNIENCWFEESCSIGSPVIANHKSCFIGFNSYMNQGGYIRSYSFIGRYTSIGRRVSIGAGVHSIIGLSTSPSIRNGTATPYSDEQIMELNYKKRGHHTLIMNDVWIGDGAVIMPGVKIHSGSIVGANSVITQDVAPYSIVAGQPARTIRKRFSDIIIEKLLITEWWEIDIKKLSQLPTGNIFEFIDACEKYDKNNINIDMPTYQLKVANDK